jgi:hypothetical protein
MRIELDTLIVSSNQAHEKIRDEFESETDCAFEFDNFDEENLVLGQLEKALSVKSPEDADLEDRMEALKRLFGSCLFEREFRYLNKNGLTV